LIVDNQESKNRMGPSTKNKRQGDENEKDDRFRLDVDDDVYLKLEEALGEINKLLEKRPMAGLRLCLKMELALKILERKAAFRANSRFKISWIRISEALGKNQHWAYDRFVIGELTHERSRTKQRRQKPASRTFTSVMDNEDLTEEPPTEVKE
jgi:hypothetical protein